MEMQRVKEMHSGFVKLIVVCEMEPFNWSSLFVCLFACFAIRPF